MLKINQPKEQVKASMTRFKSRITDSDEPLVIHVKPEDIKGAVCRDHEKCVLARAILRQRASTAKWVDVGNCVVLIGTGNNTGRRYILNGQAKEQVRFFDTHDGRFAPCTLTLSAPTVRKQLGTRTAKTGGHKRGPSKKKPTR